MSQAMCLSPGTRVRVCSAALQAFYGLYGTVVRVHVCRNDGRLTYVDVEMDEGPEWEPHATFYPHEVQVLAEPAR